MLRPLTPGQTSTHYERVIARRPPEELAATGVDLGVLALGDALRNQQNGTLDHLNRSGLEGIANLETRARIEKSYELTGVMAREYLGIDEIPTPEDMAASGVDHVWLADEYERMEREDLQPRFILAPHGLGLGSTDSGHGWRRGFSKARQDISIPNNPLQAHDDGDGLWVVNSAEANWHSFDKAPENTTMPGAATPPTHETTTPDGATVQWTLRLIPGTPKPTDLNADYNGVTVDAYTKRTIIPNTPPSHQTVPELLTDKLTFIMQGETPSDTIVDGLYHYSWCDNGNPPGVGAAAPFGYWFPDYGRVFVYWLGVGRRDGNLGRRRPVG